MQQQPDLPVTEIGPPIFVRISFSNIQGDRYYFVKHKEVIRNPDGIIDFIRNTTQLVFVNKLLDDWKTDHSLKYQVLTDRKFLKIDPSTNEQIDFTNYYYNARFHMDFSDIKDGFDRLPDARTQAGELIPDIWSEVYPIEGQHGHYSITEDDKIDADLDADYVMAFYALPRGGRHRRTRTRRQSSHRRAGKHTRPRKQTRRNRN